MTLTFKYVYFHLQKDSALIRDNLWAQYEAFSLHLCSGELNEAASVFVNLYSKFPSRPKLQHYVSDLVTEVVSGQLQEGVKTGITMYKRNVHSAALVISCCHFTVLLSPLSVHDNYKHTKDLFNLLSNVTQRTLLREAAGESYILRLCTRFTFTCHRRRRMSIV